jgi:hypothetical protein
MVSLKVVHPLKFYHITNLHGRTSTGANFALTSEVPTSTILEWLQLEHKKN